MSLVVSDTSPLHYLVQLGHQQVLPQLFGQILIPPFVRTEMQQSSSNIKTRTAFMLTRSTTPDAPSARTGSGGGATKPEIEALHELRQDTS